MTNDYTAEFQADAVLQVLKGKPSDEVAVRLGIPPADLATWVEHALGNADSLFRSQKKKATSQDAVVKKLSKELEQLTIEVNWLKTRMLR